MNIRILVDVTCRISRREAENNSRPINAEIRYVLATSKDARLSVYVQYCSFLCLFMKQPHLVTFATRFYA